ncbi:unnamed protein product [Caenorhabditis angaria]|uniref:Uncharacterized protein n=1 Tax=Caenorhabditis angaria TaxID=860376 RepID=A0A9P1ISX1_9PELO|nr:unnamed protein product [Caenorhabditis angaria]
MSTVIGPCAVCALPATGHHYNVPACHGCKSFFRRSTLDNLQYPGCRLGEKCFDGVGQGERPKRCKSCRLKKCWEVGMIPQVRELRGNEEKNPEMAVVRLPDVKLIEKTRQITQTLQNLLHLDQKLIQLRASAYNPVRFPTINEIMLQPVVFHLSDKFEPMPGWPISEQQFMQQQKLLTEITFAYEDGWQTLEPGSVHDPNLVNTKDWMAFDWLLAANYVKTFPFYHTFIESDKRALIRGTIVSLASLTLLFISYQNKQADLQFPDGTCFSGNNLKEIMEFVLAVELDENFLAMFHKNTKFNAIEPLIRYNVTTEEYVFVKALVVCNPALDLTDAARECVQKYQNIYGLALLQICLINHGKRDGPARFGSLLSYVMAMIRYQGGFIELLVNLRMCARNRIGVSRKMLEDDIFFDKYAELH